jgi:hypothetical protein
MTNDTRNGRRTCATNRQVENTKVAARKERKQGKPVRKLEQLPRNKRRRRRTFKERWRGSFASMRKFPQRQFVLIVVADRPGPGNNRATANERYAPPTHNGQSCRATGLCVNEQRNIRPPELVDLLRTRLRTALSLFWSFRHVGP